MPRRPRCFQTTPNDWSVIRQIASVEVAEEMHARCAIFGRPKFKIRAGDRSTGVLNVPKLADLRQKKTANYTILRSISSL